MKDYLLIIEADTDDGDYITQTVYLSAHKVRFLEPILKKVSAALATRYNDYNWSNGGHREIANPKEIYKDLLKEEEIAEFENYVPYGQYGIHTITSIKLIKIFFELEYFKY